MKQFFMRTYALSEKGAKDMLVAIVAVTVKNLVLMLPVALLYLFTGDYLENALGIDSPAFYWGGIVLCLILMAATAIWEYNATFFATYIESGVRRVHLAEKLRKLPLSFFGKTDLADLSATIMADSEALEHSGSHQIPQFFGSILSTIIVGVSLIFFHWQMALAALWPLPIALIIVFTSKGVQNHFNRRQSEAKIDLANGVQELIEAEADLKSNNAVDAYVSGLEKKIDLIENRAIKSEVGVAAFVVSAQMILKFGIGTVAVVGSTLLLQGELTLMTFFCFLLVASRLYEPMSGTLINLAALNGLSVNVARMNRIQDFPEQDGSTDFAPTRYDISFDHVAFGYDEERSVLKDVSFVAKQGEVTAVVGPSGGGKTTVSRLAARFWDVDGGTVRLGDVDIATVDPETLLSAYAIVFQEVTLFNNTVLENIRVGKKDATDEEVLAAAKLANCDDFVAKLPNGYDTVIGENGSELSGGERQRLSIARAFLKDAPIILLDEATASLDTENETDIQRAISRLIVDKTVLIIAHRMRTVANADQIVVLDDGVVVESGSPADLLAADGAFAKMYRRQKESAAWSMAH